MPRCPPCGSAPITITFGVYPLVLTQSATAVMDGAEHAGAEPCERGGVMSTIPHRTPAAATHGPQTRPAPAGAHAPIRLCSLVRTVVGASLHERPVQGPTGALGKG